MITLRAYQLSAVDNIRNFFANKKKRVILQAPTGAGKTIMFTYVALLTAVRNKKRVLIITDRKELLTQSGGALAKFNIKYGELSAKSKILPTENVIVSMLETLKSRLKKNMYKSWLSRFDLIILDEAHKNSFNKLFDYFNKSQFIIGATATPFRKKKINELAKYYDEIVNTVSIIKLITLEYLATPHSYGVTQDLSNVKMKGGDYDNVQLSNYYSDNKIYTGIYDNYKKLTYNKKTLIFCASIKNSKEVVNELLQHDLNVKHLDSKMSDVERTEILNWFKNNDNAVLSNVGILTTGFDCPTIETIILYRATKSLPLFLQMVGRGSRTTADKKDFTILDFGNNFLEHGFWEQDRIWKLEVEQKKRKNKQPAPVKLCPNCDAILHTSATRCKYCGYEYPKKEKTKIEIKLEKLTPKEIQLEANLENFTISELEEIRQIKGYKIGWVLHKLRDFNDFKNYAELKKYKKSWAYFQHSKMYPEVPEYIN